MIRQTWSVVASLAILPKRLYYSPFESLIGALSAVTAIIGLADIGTLNSDVLYRVLPSWAATVFLLSYLMSGLCLLVGVATLYAPIESVGLVIISSSQIARAIAAAYLLGPSNASIALAFAVLVVGACWARLWALLRVRGSNG